MGGALTTPPIDWPRVICDLMAHGVQKRGIAASLGRSRRWVVRLRHGARGSVRFSDGCRLVYLWCETTKMPPSNIPRTP